MIRVNPTFNKGQSVIELLIGVGLISIILLAGVMITTLSVQMAGLSANREQAILVAREGIEAMRAQRNTLPWSEFIALEPMTETFGEKVIFTRTIEVTPDSNEPSNDNKRQIEVVVQWDDVKGSHEMKRTTFLTNW